MTPLALTRYVGLPPFPPRIGRIEELAVDLWWSWHPAARQVFRRLDYQLWCGPAMGAFNAWVRGSFLAPVANRTVVQIALNLLEGAAVVTRAQQLRSYGLPVPGTVFDFRPRPLES